MENFQVVDVNVDETQTENTVVPNAQHQEQVEPEPEPESECHDLKNIQYKTMLIHGKSRELVPRYKSNQNDPERINQFLENEKNKDKKQSWLRLNRIQKVQKLTTYLEKYATSQQLTEFELTNLKTYIMKALERKKLQRMTEIKYNKETGIIEDIPILSFNTLTRKFTLKHTQTASTLSSLGSGSNSGSLKQKQQDKLDKHDKSGKTKSSLQKTRKRQEKISSPSPMNQTQPPTFPNQ
jgi:hypothetical protein